MKLINRNLKFLSGLFGIAAFAHFCVQAQGVEKRPTRIFTHESDVDTFFTWQVFPRWAGDRLIGYYDNNSSGPVIYTIDRNRQRDETLFTLQDEARITIFDIAGSPDGEIAIVAGALTADTRGASFVARISRDRKRQTITRTWPYCPHLVTFAAGSRPCRLLPVRAALLHGSRDRVGWFTGKEYIEFSLDGVEICHYPGPAGADPERSRGWPSVRTMMSC